MAKKTKKEGPDIIGQNKQARRNYEFIEIFEAGLELKGGEVKSLREGRVSFKDGYVRLKGGEAWLVGVHIAPYENVSAYDQPDPERERRLLLHKTEIMKLTAKTEQKGLTVVPVKMYWSRGKAKLTIALAKGKNTVSRKEDLKARDIARDTQRQLAAYK
ncbi:MAG: SsrA-binding protein SmpB [Desulfovibrionaceae bacterium]